LNRILPTATFCWIHLAATVRFSKWTDFLALSIAKTPDIFSERFPTPLTDRLNSAKERVSCYFSKLFSRFSNEHLILQKNNSKKP